MGLITILSGIISGSRNRDIRASIYDYAATSLEGKEISLSDYKGKPLLIVNTASKCGYTGQYADLQKLHDQFKDSLTIIGFPANNFLWQEPGSSEEIADFCERNYGVKFQLFEKISVKGKDQHPIYQWLEAKSGKRPSWNFCKYLIDKSGNVAGFFSAKVNPLDEKILHRIKEIT
ncbi:MAG TPA: glutathione peroxidase [Ohtaekwangia sp.]|nr:glutathione peroxidase [Ohtaekwangia sp.]